jgi:hypothetical protein
MSLLSKGGVGPFSAFWFQTLPLSHSPLKPAVPAEKRNHISLLQPVIKLKSMNEVTKIND